MPLSVNIGQLSFLVLVENGRNFHQNWVRKRSEMVGIWQKPPPGGGLLGLKTKFLEDCFSEMEKSRIHSKFDIFFTNFRES